MATYSQIDTDHERSLTSQLRAHATDKATNGPRRLSRSIHGSGYYHCGRQQLYGLLGYEQTDARYVWAWDLAARAGDAIHALVQTEFETSGKCVILPNGKPAIEVSLGFESLPEPVAKEFASYKLGCRIDAVLEGSNGSHIPIEIKTIDPKYLNGSNQKYFPAKLADYEAQLQMTLHWYRNHKTGERSSNGLIYVVNRADVTDRREYVVEYDALFVEAELERVANIRDHWLQVKLSDPEPGRGPCSFCNWKTACPLPESQKK